MKIAIDGPSGSGKSTISKAIARKLEIGYLDTGAMYRAVTSWLLQSKNQLVSDWESKLSNLPKMDISTNPDEFSIQIDNVDVSQEIRTQRITDSVSQVSANPSIRNWMVSLQQQIVNQLGSIVMEGRDISSVVMPDADVKIFITADLDQRAKRRSIEMQQESTLTQNSLLSRDQKDSSRTVSPLTKTQDAIEIDTTFLSIEESIELALEIVRGKIANG
jgi:CMP/dCMP kinase